LSPSFQLLINNVECLVADEENPRTGAQSCPQINRSCEERRGFSYGGQTRLIVGRFGTSLVSDGPGGRGCLRWGYNGARGEGVGSTRPKCCFQHIIKLFNEFKPRQLYIGLGTLVVSSFPCQVCDQLVARMYKLRIECHHQRINWSQGRETNDGSLSLWYERADGWRAASDGAEWLY
jgi:hypothetical protein